MNSRAAMIPGKGNEPSRPSNHILGLKETHALSQVTSHIVDGIIVSFAVSGRRWSLESRRHTKRISVMLKGCELRWLHVSAAENRLIEVVMPDSAKWQVEAEDGRLDFKRPFPK